MSCSHSLWVETVWEAGTPSHLYVLAAHNYGWVTGTRRVTSGLGHTRPTAPCLASHPFNVICCRLSDERTGASDLDLEPCLKRRTQTSCRLAGFHPQPVFTVLTACPVPTWERAAVASQTFVWPPSHHPYFLRVYTYTCVYLYALMCTFL